jgi:Fe-Mn family superoxide dismutase
MMIKTLSTPAKRVISSSRAMSTFKLPDLKYDVSALEPIVSAQIMSIHHSKHHATYVNNLNVASEQLAEAQAKGDISAVIALQGAIKFNGGYLESCSVVQCGRDMPHTLSLSLSHTHTL